MGQQEQAGAMREQYSVHNELEEYVRLVPQDQVLRRNTRSPGPPGIQSATSQDLEHQDRQSATSRRMAQSRAFDVFHIAAVPARGQKLLLQVLRSWHNRRSPPESPLEVGITDELVLMLEAQHLNAEQAPNVALIPGLKHVLLVFDEEGTLDSASIDGAES